MSPSERTPSCPPPCPLLPFFHHRFLSPRYRQCLGELEHNLAAMEASLAPPSPPEEEQKPHQKQEQRGRPPPRTLGAPSSLPPGMEGILAEGLRQLSMRVGADCRERRVVVTHQLELLEGLAAPAHARVLMWLAVQVLCTRVG